jgi:mannose-6-phosphate isomerase-like protein (cupin superfamily)
MKASSNALGHLTGRTGRSVLLFVLVGAAISGAGVAAIRRRPRTAPGEVEDGSRRGSSATGARSGTIENPLVGHEVRFFGDRLLILESARETLDGSIRGEYLAPPRGKVPEHVHPVQEERFEVVSGTLGVRVGGREMVLSPGQSAVGPPGVPHEWWNPSDEEEVRFLVGIRPGLGVEAVLETVLGLAREGKTVGPVPKNPLQLAVLVREAGSWGHVTGVLGQVQKAFFAPVALLASIGSLFGYRASYPKYSLSKTRGPNEHRDD